MPPVDFALLFGAPESFQRLLRADSSLRYLPAVADWMRGLASHAGPRARAAQPTHAPVLFFLPGLPHSFWPATPAVPLAHKGKSKISDLQLFVTRTVIQNILLRGHSFVGSRSKEQPQSEQLRTVRRKGRRQKIHVQECDASLLPGPFSTIHREAFDEIMSAGRSI